jgi:DNA-binding transcriptional regulator YiaG
LFTKQIVGLRYNIKDKKMTPQEIFELRQSLNISMNDFGKFFSVSTAAVQKWENGTNRPSPVVEVSMQQLKSKIEMARASGRENEERDKIVRLIVFGGLAAFLIYLFSRD